MLELGGEAAVAGHRGPAVVEQLAVRLADVDHRLDREEHSRPKLRAGAGAAGMNHLGRIVEHPAEAVAAELAHDAVAMLLGMGLDGARDVAEAIAGARLLDAEHQTLIGDVD